MFNVIRRVGAGLLLLALPATAWAQPSEAERRYPIHEVYTGGVGIPAAITNLGEYIKLFEGTDYGPTVVRVGTGGGLRAWRRDPAEFEKRIRFPFDRFGLGVRVTITFYDHKLADQMVARGDADEFLHALGKILRRLRDDGCPYIAITPFAETIGIHSSKRHQAITLRDGTYFKAAFKRVVETIRSEVEVDHVVLHLNSANRRVIDEYVPDPAYWDSFGLTCGRPDQLANVKKALGIIKELYPDKMFSMPEWKSQSTSLEDPAAWALIGEVFELDAPFAILSWDNKDPAEKTWGYPEMRWQKAHPDNLAKWKAAWAKIRE